MKVALKTARKFEPIDMAVTIETREELDELVTQLGKTTGKVTYPLYTVLRDQLKWIA